MKWWLGLVRICKYKQKSFQNNCLVLQNDIFKKDENLKDESEQEKKSCSGFVFSSGGWREESIAC